MLYTYLVVTKNDVSFVLVRNDDGIQRPIYYVSKSLQEVETRYLPLEKAVLTIVHATRKLPHYFHAHTIVVLTQLPLQALLRKSNYIGRIAKWGTKLGSLRCQVHASNRHKRIGFSRLCSRVRRGCPREGKCSYKCIGFVGHGCPLVESLYEWSLQPKRVRSGDCVGHPREAGNGEIIMTRILNHQQ